MTIATLAEAIAQHDPALSRRHASLILDEEQCLVGLITRSDLVRAMESGQHSQPVGAVAAGELVVAYPHETLRDALVKMLRHKVGRLPVVNPGDSRKLVGYLGRSEILGAETVESREPGMIERLFTREPASASHS